MVSLQAVASKVPLAPATEEAIVDCVALFYEGKGCENFRKKNKFRCKVKREETVLAEFFCCFAVLAEFFCCFAVVDDFFLRFCGF